MSTTEAIAAFCWSRRSCALSTLKSTPKLFASGPRRPLPLSAALIGLKPESLIEPGSLSEPLSSSSRSATARVGSAGSRSAPRDGGGDGGSYLACPRQSPRQSLSLQTRTCRLRRRSWLGWAWLTRARLTLEVLIAWERRSGGVEECGSRCWLSDARRGETKLLAEEMVSQKRGARRTLRGSGGGAWTLFPRDPMSLSFRLSRARTSHSTAQPHLIARTQAATRVLPQLNFAAPQTAGRAQRGGTQAGAHERDDGASEALLTFHSSRDSPA